MLVERLQTVDLESATEIGRATGSQYDLSAEIERTFARMWVVREAAASPPIAFALAWFVADEVHLLHLATHPRWRRRGAARALMNVLLEEAQSRGARLVVLEVRRTNQPALSLYESHGFRAVGVRHGYYADDAEDAIEMLLTLTPDSQDPAATRKELS